MEQPFDFYVGPEDLPQNQIFSHDFRTTNKIVWCIRNNFFHYISQWKCIKQTIFQNKSEANYCFEKNRKTNIFLKHLPPQPSHRNQMVAPNGNKVLFTVLI